MKTGNVLALFAATTLAACASTPQRAAPAEPTLHVAPPANAATTPETPPRDDTAIADELNAMAEQDQSVRQKLISWMQAHPGENIPAHFASEMSDIDHRNAARVATIIDEIGWPTASTVGSEAAGNAWLIIQHAVHDIPLMQRSLALMEPYLGTGEIDDQDYALLYDRVQIQTGHPQRYGSQCTELIIDGVKHFGFQPIEDVEHVDDRRREVGLPTLTDYERRIRAAYGVPDDTPAIPLDMTMDEYNAIVAAMRATRESGDGGNPG